MLLFLTHVCWVVLSYVMSNMNLIWVILIQRLIFFCLTRHWVDFNPAFFIVFIKSLFSVFIKLLPKHHPTQTLFML